MIPELQQFALLVNLAVIKRLRTCFGGSDGGKYDLCYHWGCIGWSWNSHSNTIVWKTPYRTIIVEGDEFGGIVLDEVKADVSRRFMARCHHANSNKIV